MPFSPTSRVLSALCAGTAAGLSLALPAGAATPTYVPGSGSAYGSYAAVGSVQSGTTSPVSLCTTKGPDERSNSTGAVNLAGIGTIGAVTTRTSTNVLLGTRSTVSSTSTAGVNLLGGLVQASAITTRATVSRTATGTTTTKGETTFAGLRVGGVAVSATPKANTTLTIADVATVQLNTQVGADSQSFTVTGLRVNLLSGNRLRLATGTVIVGRSVASTGAPVHHLPYGNAYATQVDVAGKVTSGRTAAVGLPCGGSYGKTLTNRLAAVSVPRVLTTGAGTSTAASTDSATSTSATTSNTIASVRLLDGLVTLKGVTTRANAVRTATGVTTSSTGTSVTGLQVRGTSVTVGTGENAKVSLAGIGTLTVRGTTRTSTGITVHAAELTLDTAVAGLSKGTVLTVGSSAAGVADR